MPKKTKQKLSIKAVPNTKTLNDILLEASQAVKQSAEYSLKNAVTTEYRWPRYPNHNCPNCGACPNCGRGGYTPYRPYTPWYGDNVWVGDAPLNWNY